MNGEAGRGKLIVLSAPSGSGKTTIAREIIRLNPNIRFSVSATTRRQRDGERDGDDYFFLTREEFRRRVDGGEFVEWEELFGNYYGTLRSELDRAIRENRNLLFDVDVKGGLSIQKAYPAALMIFIRTPGVEILKQRLRKRKTETEEVLSMRLDRVPMELSMGDRYTHQVVNDDLATAVGEVHEIIQKYLQS
ncbi:MAG: guanylate kinase [Ignavibacteria bacterium]|nr:guanylate kinase [Ignavibacteria bacterium]